MKLALSDSLPFACSCPSLSGMLLTFAFVILMQVPPLDAWPLALGLSLASSCTTKPPLQSHPNEPPIISPSHTTHRNLLIITFSISQVSDVSPKLMPPLLPSIFAACQVQAHCNPPCALRSSQPPSNFPAKFPPFPPFPRTAS